MDLTFLVISCLIAVVGGLVSALERRFSGTLSFTIWLVSLVVNFFSPLAQPTDYKTIASVVTFIVWLFTIMVVTYVKHCREVANSRGHNPRR